MYGLSRYSICSDSTAQDPAVGVPPHDVDNSLKKQQKLLGCTARALSKGLERMERPLASNQEIANKIVDENVRNQLLDAVDVMQTDAVAPLGHALRYLASGFNDISFKRRDLAAAQINNKGLQQQVKAATLGLDTFFKEDINQALTTAASQQQQQALTSALRRGSSYRQSDDRQRERRDRSRSQMRRDRYRPRQRSSRPFKRGPSRGGTSRGGCGSGRRR